MRVISLVGATVLKKGRTPVSGTLRVSASLRTDRKVNIELLKLVKEVFRFSIASVV